MTEYSLTRFHYRRQEFYAARQLVTGVIGQKKMILVIYGRFPLLKVVAVSQSIISWLTYLWKSLF
jgi:hypothetical protein